MKRALRLLDGLCLFLSPIAILFFLLSAVLLPVYLREHPSYVAQLEEEGRVATATVTYLYDDGDVLLAFADDAGIAQSQILDPLFYPPEVRRTLQLDSTHQIRYLASYQEGPVLEAHFDRVRAYRKPMGGLYFLLVLSWIVLVIRPDFLYIGYVTDLEALAARRLPVPGAEGKS